MKRQKSLEMKYEKRSGMTNDDESLIAQTTPSNSNS